MGKIVFLFKSYNDRYYFCFIKNCILKDNLTSIALVQLSLVGVNKSVSMYESLTVACSCDSYAGYFSVAWLIATLAFLHGSTKTIPEVMVSEWSLDISEKIDTRVS